MATYQQQLVKCIFTDDKANSKEIRKFLVNKKEAGSFKIISGKIRNLFSQIKAAEFRVFYIDEEGDKITVSSDEELSVAYITLGTSPAARLSVELTGNREPGINQVPFELQSCKGEIHKGVICDVCDSEIRGFRYKCVKCPDFDLCGRCEAAGNHPGHMMVRVSGPLDQFPRIFRAVRGVDGSWVGRGRDYRSSCGRNARQEATGNPEPGTRPFPQRSFSCKADSASRRSHGLQRGSEFLKNVGTSIASFLEPLGIDVHVDVHTEGENVHCAPFGEASTSTPKNIPVDHFQAAAAAAEKASAALAAAEQAIHAVKVVKEGTEATQLKLSPVETAEAKEETLSNSETSRTDVTKENPAVATEDNPAVVIEENPAVATEENLAVATEENPAVAIEENPAAATEENGAMAVEKNLIEDSKVSSFPSSDSGDWFFINGEKPSQETMEEARELGATVSVTEGATNEEVPAAGTVSDDGGATGIYPNLQSLEPSHPDPFIAAALERMLAMGFTNEGGWLSQLLEVKNGDITKVMDILHGPF